MPSISMSDKTIVIVSSVALIVAGLVFIYEAIRYYQMKAEQPDIPDKIYLAASLALLIGIIDIIFGIAHFFFI